MKRIHVLEGFILSAMLLVIAVFPCSANSNQLSFTLTASGSPNSVSGGSGNAEFISGDLVVDVSFESGPITSTTTSCFDFGCVPSGISYGPGGLLDISISFDGVLSAQLAGTFLNSDESLLYFSNGDVFGDDISGAFILDGFAGSGQLSLIHTNHTAGELDSASLTYSGTATPEPSTLVLTCTGLLALLALHAKKYSESSFPVSRSRK